MRFRGMGEAINIKPKNAEMSGTEREIICTFSSSSSQKPNSDEAEDRKGEKTHTHTQTTLES